MTVGIIAGSVISQNLIARFGPRPCCAAAWASARPACCG